MSDETSTAPTGWLGRPGDAPPERLDLAWVILWSQAEPQRVGELAYLPAAGRCVLGRGPARREDPGPRLFFGPARPGARCEPRPLASPGLSRTQIVIATRGDALHVERVGKARVLQNGRPADDVSVEPGDLLEIDRELLLLCVARSAAMTGNRAPSFAFGEPDEFGLVGEGSEAWALRDAVALAARRNGHVLVTGPSGAGKELAARALHTLSPRASGPFVARNAATLPEGIIDAELFGNAKNFPNPGMRERTGLIGEADGGTLFLDEVGDLPEELQAHLLRVLDQGEYHRLGEDRARRVDLRVVAATNRGREALKQDFAARFRQEIRVPGLDERPEDIPLLVRHVLFDLARTDREVAARFFDDEPRVAPELVAALVQHQWTGNVRELESLLLQAVAESDAHFIALTRGVRERIHLPRREAPTAAEIEAALTATAGNVSRAFRTLGLPSRDALNRLIRKYGIRVKR
ncbi:MAG: sigma 54-interacting transcriptional regulator [Polyangiaceae bacterium]